MKALWKRAYVAPFLRRSKGSSGAAPEIERRGIAKNKSANTALQAD